MRAFKKERYTPVAPLGLFFREQHLFYTHATPLGLKTTRHCEIISPMIDRAIYSKV